jgi:hypothetical protein
MVALSIEPGGDFSSEKKEKEHFKVEILTTFFISGSFCHENIR